jgi:hypothetical protein
MTYAATKLSLMSDDVVILHPSSDLAVSLTPDIICQQWWDQA